MMSNQQITEYHNKVDNNIKNNGYHITYIFANERPSFCYSTGIFKSFGIPDIFISALPQNLSGELVENYVKVFKDSDIVRVEEKLENLSNRFSIYLIDVPIENLKEHVLSSVRYYGENEYRYVQLVYPDTQ